MEARRRSGNCIIGQLSNLKALLLFSNYPITKLLNYQFIVRVAVVDYFFAAICAMNVPQFASKVLRAAGMYSEAIQIVPCSSTTAAE